MSRAFVALALLLAPGCLTPSPDPAAVPPDAGLGVDLPWELLDCTFFNVDVDVPAERLDARLPEGFALDADPSPLAPIQGGAPYLGLEAFDCPDGRDWASFYTSVVPPPDLEMADHLHFVMWDTLYGDDAARDALAPRGYPVREGEVVISAEATGLRADIEIEELGALVFQGALAREGTPFEGDFVEYMEAEDGTLAAWRTHYAATSLAQGRAAIRVPAGSWLAEVLGAERAQGTFITGTWSFTNGSIRVR